MLSEPKISVFIPTVKPDQSKEFYMNILGLNLVSEDQFALEFDSDGTILRITIVATLIPQPFTISGFKIDKIRSQVKSLIEKGVKFERYNSLDQDDMGIWTSPSGAQIAWFKDPDGNILSLTEYPI